ncbi:protein translocase SEC61 complex subunit gamma [archaeon]|nr:protein translocase SEC61 complex subunit gamma [archaeon]
MQFQENWTKFKSFIKECKRVLFVTKKPNKEEFKGIVKVTGIGILIIGLIGALIAIASVLTGI